MEEGTKRSDLQPVAPIKGSLVKTGPKTGKAEILEENIEDIIEAFINGKTFTEIADHYGVSQTTLWTFRANSKYSAQIEAAMQASAESYAEESIDVLREVQHSDSVAEVMAAKELSQALRWRASKRNPRVFGNNPEIEREEPTKAVDEKTFDILMEQAKKMAKDADKQIEDLEFQEVKDDE